MFDKLFGGKRGEADANANGASPSAPMPSSVSPATPLPEGPVPPRRERSKPSEVTAGDAAQLAPLPMDGDNAALLAAIQGVVAADNVETRRVLYATLLNAELLLVSMGGDDLGTGEITLQEGQQLMLATMKGPDGQVYLPAFTDVERLSRTLPEKARYLRMPAPVVCRMFLQGGGEGILINAGMPPSGVITRAEAEILATGNAPQLNEKGQLQAQAQQEMRIVIGKPEKAPPESFIAAIAAKAAELPQVREAHVFQAAIADGAPRLMIGLLMDSELTPEQMQPSFEVIGKAALAARGDGAAFDMMPLNDQMIEAIRPVEGIVYSRDQQV